MGDIWEKIKQEKKHREAMFPTEDSCIKTALEIQLRLEDLGWRSGPYYPKDGTLFAGLIDGLRGPAICQYVGDWPNGSVFSSADDDLWPCQCVMFKPLDQPTPDDKPVAM